ncbi:MAG: thiamine diphosphokinase [Eubacteriales bacterium]
MKNRCVIIAGSPLFTSIEITAEDFVIAADIGYKHSLATGITPDLIIGDFDSLIEVPPDSIKTIKAPKNKDDTDTMLAVKYALGQGYTHFVLLGALGGRLDHQTANISTCAYIAEQGGVCEIHDSTNIIYAIKNSQIRLEKRENWSVSVFSYTDKAVGVTLNGLKYALDNATLTNTFPMGVSNEFAEDSATVEVKDGILLVIMSDMADI